MISLFEYELAASATIGLFIELCGISHEMLDISHQGAFFLHEPGLPRGRKFLGVTCFDVHL
jgi:hypothetical protein